MVSGKRNSTRFAQSLNAPAPMVSIPLIPSESSVSSSMITFFTLSLFENEVGAIVFTVYTTSLLSNLNVRGIGRSV